MKNLAKALLSKESGKTGNEKHLVYINAACKITLEISSPKGRILVDIDVDADGSSTLARVDFTNDTDT